MRRAPALALAAMLLAAPLGAAPPHAHRHALGASAAFDAQGRLWAVTVQGEQLLLHRSADAGVTWSGVRAVNVQPEPIGADGDARPKLATGPSGEIYVTWTRPLAKPYAGEVRFARSLDGGASFSAPITVHTDRQEITHRFDALAVAPDGRVFVAWIDKRDLEAAKARGADYRGAAVYVAMSDDRGASFRGDYKLADHSCECCRIALLADGDGVLALWRHVFAPNVRDHALARMTGDGAAGPLTRASFDDWRVDACPHHGPGLARDADGDLHAVWYTQAEGRAGVHYGRLREGGVEGARTVGGEGAAHADIAADGHRLAIAWKEFDGTRTRLRALRSDDAGASWQAHELAASDSASAQPQVLVHDGRFHVFWHTRETALRVLALP